MSGWIQRTQWPSDMGHYKIVKKLLLADDLDVNIQDSDGHKALVWAADKGQMDIVRTLLGALSFDTNLQSKE